MLYHLLFDYSVVVHIWGMLANPQCGRFHRPYWGLHYSTALQSPYMQGNMMDDVGANHHLPALAETLLDGVMTAKQSKSVAPSDAERSEATGGNTNPTNPSDCSAVE